MKILIAMLLVFIATAVSARFTDVTAQSSDAKNITSKPLSDTLTTAQSAAVRDGSHDFNFIYGKWRMPNHMLKNRLADSHEWVDFITCDEGGPLPGGIGDT